MEQTPLTGPELDTLENYALAASEEDPDDPVPRAVIKLLVENAEMRNLLRRDEKGDLVALAKLSSEVERLEGELRVARSCQADQLAINQRLKEAEGRLIKENVQLAERIRKFDVVLNQIITILNMARDRLLEQQSPEDLGALLMLAGREYDSTRQENGGTPRWWDTRR